MEGRGRISRKPEVKGMAAFDPLQTQEGLGVCMLVVGRMAPKMPMTTTCSLEDSCFYVAVCLDGTNGWRRCRIVSELPSVEVGRLEGLRVAGE